MLIGLLHVYKVFFLGQALFLSFITAMLAPVSFMMMETKPNTVYGTATITACICSAIYWLIVIVYAIGFH